MLSRILMIGISGYGHATEGSIGRDAARVRDWGGIIGIAGVNLRILGGIIVGRGGAQGADAAGVADVPMVSLAEVGGLLLLLGEMMIKGV
jgi:hypothetical protein